MSLQLRGQEKGVMGEVAAGQVDGEATFEEIASRVNRTLREALAHRDLPFEHLTTP